MRKSTSSKRKTRRQTSKKRSKMIKGGSNVVFPPTFSNSAVTTYPQSYLPYNNFENDPGYSVINARNSGPFLTGMVNGGKRRNHSRKRLRGCRRIVGGGSASSSISNIVNGAANNAGIIPAPAFNELSGVAGLMSGFSNTGAAYSPTSVNIAPLA